MNKDGSFDQNPRRRPVPIAAMLPKFSLFDQLIQNVLDLLARTRSRFEFLEDARQARSAVPGLLDVPKQVFLIKDWFLPSTHDTRARLLCPHTPSLLTSPIEEHR